MALPKRKSAPPHKLNTPEDAICKVTGCGRLHAKRMVEVIGQDAAERVLAESKKPKGNPRLEFQKAYSASTAPSPHAIPPGTEGFGMKSKPDDTDVVVDK